MQDLFGPIVVGAGFGVQQPTNTVSNVSGVGVQRRFESGVTDRLNQAHWELADVNTGTINDSLTYDLELIQRRATWESLNNATVEGAIETYATDVVGADGPGLQMLTDDDRFNAAIEENWADWCENCDATHDFALVDLLHGWVSQLWTSGEFLSQELNSMPTGGRRGLDNYKILDLGADRLDYQTPINGSVVCGVEVNKIGRPVAYWINDPGHTQGRQRIEAKYIVHAFRRRFAGQQRGIPLLASSLQPVADVRDYDAQVLDAARIAADNAYWMVADHVDAPFLDITAGTESTTKRRTGKYAPAGWRPHAMEARHPVANYVDFRSERQRELGQPAQMPLLVLKQDAGRHSFSSARFDSLRYDRSIKRVQSWLVRRALDRFLLRVIEFSRMLGKAPRFSGRLDWAFTWTRPPSIDPEREALAERILMENGTLAYSQACANHGLRADQTIQVRQRDNQALEAAGLPPILGAIPTTFLPENDPFDGQEDMQQQGTPSHEQTSSTI